MSILNGYTNNYESMSHKEKIFLQKKPLESFKIKFDSASCLKCYKTD